MKIIEELKAAQEVCEMCHCHVCENTYFDKYERDCIEAVLRRIPQLIEVVEWIGEYRMNLDNNKFAFDGLSQFEKGEEHVIDQLLSKLASSDAGATRPLEGKKDE